MRIVIAATFILLIAAVALPTPDLLAQAPTKEYPPGVATVHYRSSGDGSRQPMLFWKPEAAGGKAPLLVALHSWSGNYAQSSGEAYARWCQQEGWVFAHPHFRGPNWTPQAMGSDLVAADILSAVEFAKTQAAVDESRIYCVGVSGGGHAALLMAGRAPEIWAGVSAWCGIADIAAWHRECIQNKERFGKYAQHIEKALGGAPQSSAKLRESAAYRSPLTWLAGAGNVPLDINHGIHDGRSGSVPFTHALHAWNAVAPVEAWISPSTIAEFYRTQTPPQPFAGKDPLYGPHQPLYRKTSGKTRLTIFDGGHQIVHEAALSWLAVQTRNPKSET